MAREKNKPVPTKKYRHHKRYQGGVIRATPSGNYQAEINHGQRRHRQTFETEGDCRAWIESSMMDLGRATAPLTASETIDARRALALLGDTVSLADAARYWVEGHTSPEKSVSDAVDEFLTEKRRAGLRDKSIKTLAGQIGALRADMGYAIVGQIDGAALLDWLDGRGVEDETRDNYRRSLANFFAWSIRMGYCAKNPASAITHYRRDEKMPGIMTVRQSWRLLHAAERIHSELVPYIALGLFAGIRPEELSKLQWTAITHHIHIGPEVAKLRQQRFVAIAANLGRWLAAYRGTGPILPYKFRWACRMMAEVRKLAGIKKWPQDCMRHSFASYHLAVGRDAAATSHELGHGTTAQLFRHYRALATERQGLRFFKILPAQCPKNVS